MMRFDFKLKGEKIWYLILILVLVISNRYFTNELAKKIDLSDYNNISKALLKISGIFCFWYYQYNFIIFNNQKHYKFNLFK